ncbi:hypothetical protein K2X83_01795 [Patescibacteria group bacterium]|nr:hypothetical protein [Patescibacteria group bacterium]
MDWKFLGLHGRSGNDQEKAPVRLIEDQTEGRYIAMRIPTSHVEGLIEYAKTYRHVNARVNILVCEGERYAYIKANGDTSDIQTVEKGMTLVGTYGFIDEKGTLSPYYASNSEQFLNNGMLFATDYAHTASNKEK